MCPYLCNEEFYDPGDGSCAPCTVLDNCERGQFLTGRCVQDSTPTCVPCLDIPPNAYAVDVGCAWMCDNDRYRDTTGTMCVLCLTECLQGEYLSGECTQYTAPECLTCLNAPADARYNATAAAGETECDFVCLARRYYSSLTNQCLECTVAADCAAGEVVSGVCSTESNPMCVACDPGRPANAFYTTPGSCDWLCAVDRYRVGDECVLCSDACPVGLYPAGTCGGTETYTCMACENRDETEYYVGQGTVNGTNSCPTADCETTCPPGETLVGGCLRVSGPVCGPCSGALPPNSVYILECVSECLEDYYLSTGNGVGGDVCTECRTACPAGQVLVDSCTPETDNECVPCDMPLPAGAEWTRECEFECVPGRYSSAPRTCTLCLDVCGLRAVPFRIVRWGEQLRMFGLCRCVVYAVLHVQRDDGQRCGVLLYFGLRCGVRGRGGGCAGRRVRRVLGPGMRGRRGEPAELVVPGCVHVHVRLDVR